MLQQKKTKQTQVYTAILIDLSKGKFDLQKLTDLQCKTQLIARNIEIYQGICTFQQSLYVLETGTYDKFIHSHALYQLKHWSKLLFEILQDFDFQTPVK